MRDLRARDARAGSLLLLLSALAWSGCAPLPNVAPFVDGTIQLRSAIIATGAAVEDELRAAPGTKSSADELARQWKLRVQAADALVDYTESLAALVRAGQDGGTAARELADAAGNLARTVGIALPAAGAAATATDLAAFVYGHIAAARAARSLGDALVNVQPAVDQLAGKLAGDLADADILLRAAHALQVTQVSTQYDQETGYLESLKAERRRIYQKASRTGEDEKRLLELEQLLAATRSWRDPMEATLKEAETRLKAGRELVAAGRQAVTEWALTHKHLAGAVRERRAVDAAALAQATLEIRTLIRRMREL